MQIFQEYKKDIQNYLFQWFEYKKKEFAVINPFGEELLEKMLSFTKKGKMIRGGLVFLINQIFGNKNKHALIETASALELIQSALLIHDDIMDKDEMRRGEKTVYYQYQEKAENIGLRDSLHFGQSMGICAGDIAFFLAFEILYQTQLPENLKQKIITLYARELSYVGLAQMQDIYFSFLPSLENIKEESILSLYRYKTARYTFSLPMKTGAILSEAPEEQVELLDKIGENLGLIFQIKDDEIGLLGKSEITGKPIGSDIKEAKKTLFALFLFQEIEKQDLLQFKTLFGNPHIQEKEIQWVKSLLEKYGILKKIQGIVNQLKEETINKINQLTILENHRKQLFQLLEYSLQREK